MVAVAGGHRDVFHGGAGALEHHEHGALEEPARVQAIQVERARRGAMDGGVAVGRVEDVPLPAGRFDEKRQPRVAHQASERHAPQRVQVVKAVALGIVGPPRRERLDQRRQVRRVHLVVGVHFFTQTSMSWRSA